MPEAVWVGFPIGDRPLPTPADLQRIEQCPLAQMFVVGRSGSGLVHAFLDGHPQVLHVPHTFKFYDFVGQNADALARGPEAVIDAFCASPLVAFLFDSSRSVIIGGRLGPGMSTYVTVDRGWFRRGFLSTIGHRRLTWRVVFLALVLTYGVAIGQDASRARVVFHHLHHGDWLWPERLIEASNYQVPLPAPAADILRADTFVLSVREPRDSAVAYRRFIDGQQLPESQRLDAHDQFNRLLLQDWDRLMLATRSQTPSYIVRLEDIRADAPGVMARLAAFLGIDPTHAALQSLTYYGFAWYGDIYTPPSATIHPTRPPADLPWQDRWYIDASLGRAAERFGYPRRSAIALKRALLGATAMLPSPSLVDRSMTDAAAAKQAAAARAAARVAFARTMIGRLA